VSWFNSKDALTLKQGYAAVARHIYHDHPLLVHLKAVMEGSDLDKALAEQRWK